MKQQYSIILFDGVCNFCDASVQFIIQHDPKRKYRFASLQSKIGQTYIEKFPALEHIDSIILLENDTYYIHSDAVLRITKQLNGFWKCFYVFICIPRWIRNPLYRFVAKHRYTWFGKKESCMIPTKEIRDRFLSDTDEEK